MGGSANLLVRYINSGRVEADHAVLSPRRVTGLLTTQPDRLDEDQHALRDQLAGACRDMVPLAHKIPTFAWLLVPARGNDGELTDWIIRTRAADLPFLHAFATGLERDRAAVDAAVTLPWHNGCTEGTNTVKDQAHQTPALWLSWPPPPASTHRAQLTPQSRRSTPTKFLEEPLMNSPACGQADRSSRTGCREITPKP